MIDIVERLRDIEGEWADAEIREEAAEKIERLRNDYSILKRDYDELRAENESLRRALDVVPGKPTEQDIEWARRALEPKP